MKTHIVGGGLWVYTVRLPGASDSMPARTRTAYPVPALSTVLIPCISIIHAVCCRGRRDFLGEESCWFSLFSSLLICLFAVVVVVS